MNDGWQCAMKKGRHLSAFPEMRAVERHLKRLLRVQGRLIMLVMPAVEFYHLE